MEPIIKGQRGAAVEDVQVRLGKIGYSISAEETEAGLFGESTLAAVRSFRTRQGLSSADFIDDEAWIELVDESYALGDRTLYLRLPHFHGADVSRLQMTLNVMGFSCGAVDGAYGPHTEAAVREFQANMGLLADGIAFQDTFDAIMRLQHIWSGRTPLPEFSEPRTALARAVDVLEERRVLVSATDQIARTVASRIWNVAFATTEDAKISLVEVEGLTPETVRDADLALVIATKPLAESTAALPPNTMNLPTDGDAVRLGQSLASLVRATPGAGRCVRIELTQLNRYDGSVTSRMCQTAAIMLLDALSSTFTE